jgi:hypothetical protein
MSEILHLWIIAEGVFLHWLLVLKISSMRFYARLDTSHHGPLHPFEGASVVGDSLTDIRNAMVKCLFVVNMSCIHKGRRCSHRGYKSGERRGHAGGPPLPNHWSWYVLLRTSGTGRLKCGGSPSRMCSIISAQLTNYIFPLTCCYGRFLVLDCGNRARRLSTSTFQLYFVYIPLQSPPVDGQ